jgi:tetratricopeptide (TPR) repeat protein
MNKTFPIFVSLLVSTTGIFAADLTPSAPLSPAEMGIKKAQAQIAQHPDHVPYYSALAMAYARRARETSDVSYYAKAEETLKHSRELSPDDYEAGKVQTWLDLGRHDFKKALESATKLNKRAPDDVTVYGYLADANAELGNYAAAVDAAQWMLRLRAGNVAGLTRAAYLRELHGYVPGALELMQMAYDATPFQEAEDRAWLLTQIAHLHLISGDIKLAEQFAQGALGLFPNYHYALGTLAQVRVAQNRLDDAIELQRTRYAAAPHAENLYALAEVLRKGGHDEEARQAYAKFEELSLKESRITDNSNHELMAYYVDVAHEPQKAIDIAEQELTRRQDLYTLDCYAWALAAKGERQKALEFSLRSVATGTKDPVVLAHAAAIAKLAAE